MAFRKRLVPPHGSVRIIPAADMLEENRRLYGVNGRRSDDLPINAAYYMTPRAPSIAANLRHIYSPPQYYNVQQRRSKTAPPRGHPVGHLDTTVRHISPLRSRARSSAQRFNVGTYSRFSGPAKRPLPLYRKRRQHHVNPLPENIHLQNMSSARFNTPPQQQSYSYYPFDSINPGLKPAVAATTYSAWYPSATYATYPNSTFQRRQKPLTVPIKDKTEKYPVYWRFFVKLAQLVIGGGILTAVVGPSADGSMSFVEFVNATRSEGQLAVVIVVCMSAFLTLMLILTVYLSRTSQTWRNVDAILLSIMTFAHLCVACVEAWYAFCYPPYGDSFPRTCRILEWTIAAILSFINLFLYGMDLMLASSVGVDML